MKNVLAFSFAAFSLLGSCYGKPTQSELPIVDLGYERHQAFSFNETAKTYNFTNIRFGQAPVGDLRFRAPLAPKGRSSKVETGSVGRICPQGSTGAISANIAFLVDYLTGKPIDEAKYNETAAAARRIVGPRDPRETEDCLFLDVIVPEKVLKKSSSTRYGRKGAPVLVWVYGGAYTVGEKTGGGGYDPAGLIKASQSNGNDGFVWVALNYRLGAFGFLAGPTLQANGVANAGLYDQRLALEWVQKNIHLFGGDKNQVTVIGESAGGGSIVHQITAFAGLKGRAPFQRAIAQSPGWQPIVSAYQQERTFNEVLAAANVTTLDQLRHVSTDVLMTANAKVIREPSSQAIVFGPSVDGLFIPNQAPQLLAQGNFDKSVDVMVSHNTNEGILFTSLLINTTQETKAFIAETNPNIKPEIVDYIVDKLYPPVFDGSLGYKSQYERAAFMIAEAIFTCNTNYLGRAYSGKVYSYRFAVPPGLHGQDIGYTFAGRKQSGGSLDPTSENDLKVVAALQGYITSFVVDGRPRASGAPVFPEYGKDAQVVVLDPAGIKVGKDDAANERCAWWQKGLYN